MQHSLQNSEKSLVFVGQWQASEDNPQVRQIPIFIDQSTILPQLTGVRRTVVYTKIMFSFAKYTLKTSYPIFITLKQNMI